MIAVSHQVKDKRMKKLILALLLVLLSVSLVWAQPGPRPGLLVEESDGSPAGFVYKLKFSNGSLSAISGAEATVTNTPSANSIDDTMIDWGTGAGQVGIDDLDLNEGQMIVGDSGNKAAATSTIPNLAITVALATDDTWSGLAYTANAGYTSGSGEQWRVLFLDPDDANNEWQKADANVAGDFPAWGVATSDATTDGSALVVLFRGCFRNDAWQGTYADGALLYLSETAGAFTDTAPTDSTDCVQPIGRVRDNGVTCIICVNFDPIVGWATVP